MPAELDSVKPAQALQGIKGHLWEQFYLPTQLRHRLLWSPGNTGPIGVSRQVLTLHDIASLDHPEWFERKFALWYPVLLPRLIRKVRAIITVSHFSKERIVQTSRAKPESVHVIHNGVERRFRPVDSRMVNQVKAQLALTSPYLLFVGSLEPRKNLKMLLEAWELGGFDGATLAVAGTAGSHRQNHADRGPGLRRAVAAHLAHGRSRSQARISQGGPRMGPHAATHGTGGPRQRSVGQDPGPESAARDTHADARGVSQRRTAGAGGPRLHSATQTVSAGCLGLYTPGRRRRESGALFARIARLAAQTARNNITMQATVVTVVASSVSA